MIGASLNLAIDISSVPLSHIISYQVLFFFKKRKDVRTQQATCEQVLSLTIVWHDLEQCRIIFLLGSLTKLHVINFSRLGMLPITEYRFVWQKVLIVWLITSPRTCIYKDTLQHISISEAPTKSTEDPRSINTMIFTFHFVKSNIRPFIISSGEISECTFYNRKS